MSAVVELRPGGQALLTKKQLAGVLGRSERWIELKQRGRLPIASTDRFGRRRYRLADVERWLYAVPAPRKIHGGLRAAFDGGKITASLAAAAARLPDTCQRELEGQLEAGSRLSVTEVRDVARRRTAAATGELPGGLLAESAIAWQVTVRGHLSAALCAIPVHGGYDELQRATRDALAQLETVDAEDET